MCHLKEGLWLPFLTWYHISAHEKTEKTESPAYHNREQGTDWLKFPAHCIHLVYSIEKIPLSQDHVCITDQTVHVLSGCVRLIGQTVH